MSEQAPHVVWREGRASWRSHGLNLLLRLATSNALDPDADIAVLRARYERLDARCFGWPAAARREPVDCDGVPAHWVTSPHAWPGRTVLYLHGGSFAFRFPRAQTAFAARLGERLRARVLVPEYRLAPEHPFPAAPDDCERVWRWLQSRTGRPGETVLVGDSAGGNLALVTLLRARRRGDALPACAVLLSPAVDCTLASPSLRENRHRDAVLRLPRLLTLRERYVPSAELYQHPDVSPYFADLAGLPPLFMQAGASELLRDEALRVAAKAHAAGVPVEVELWPGVPHVFQLVPFLPESDEALARIGAFVRRHTGWNG